MIPFSWTHTNSMKCQEKKCGHIICKSWKEQKSSTKPVNGLRSMSAIIPSGHTLIWVRICAFSILPCSCFPSKTWWMMNKRLNGNHCVEISRSWEHIAKLKLATGLTSKESRQQLPSTQKPMSLSSIHLRSLLQNGGQEILVILAPMQWCLLD